MWTNALYVGLGLLIVGALLTWLFCLVAKRFNPSDPNEMPAGAEPAFCPLCQLTLRPQDRESHDRVCPGLLRRRRFASQRTTLILFRQEGQVRLTKIVGPFVFFGMEVSEVTYGNGDLSKVLEQVHAELREGGAS